MLIDGKKILNRLYVAIGSLFKVIFRYFLRKQTQILLLSLFFRMPNAGKCELKPNLFTTLI